VLIESLKSAVHQQLLNLRCIDRTVNTAAFMSLYENSTDQESVRQLIANNDHLGLEKWISVQAEVEYSNMTVRQLRAVGKRFGIAYYNQLSKSTLLSEIAKYASQEEARNRRADGTGENS
jgi:hypothetical protein